MATFTKLPLTGASNGLPILVVATASAGTTIHTAVAGTTNLDEIWLWATNNHTGPVDLSIEYGGTSSPLNIIKSSIDAQKGGFLILPGFILQNGLLVRAFAGVTNVVSLHGFINRITA